MSDHERFWSKVEKTESCWLWRRALTSNGYGRFYANGRMRVAHRWIYEQTVAVVPTGLQLDHLCRVRNCVNPAHLEIVTPSENRMRGDIPQSRRTHCLRCGDPLKLRPWDGKRSCRNCQRASNNRYAARRRALYGTPSAAQTLEDTPPHKESRSSSNAS